VRIGITIFRRPCTNWQDAKRPKLITGCFCVEINYLRLLRRDRSSTDRHLCV